MGLTMSVFYTSVYDKVPYIGIEREFYSSLTAKEGDISKIYYQGYKKIDITSRGSLTINEILSFISDQPTPFISKLFSPDGYHLLEFKDFFIVVWNYCTLYHADLAKFAVLLHTEEDSTHKIGDAMLITDICATIKNLYGTEFQNNQFAIGAVTKLHKISLKSGPEISYSTFQRFCDVHPSIFFPLIRLQAVLKSRIGGNDFWKKLQMRRIAFFGDRIFTKKELIIMGSSNKVTVMGNGHIQLNKNAPRDGTDRTAALSPNMGGNKILWTAAPDQNLDNISNVSVRRLVRERVGSEMTGSNHSQLNTSNQRRDSQSNTSNQRRGSYASTQRGCIDHRRTSIHSPEDTLPRRKSSVSGMTYSTQLDRLKRSSKISPSSSPKSPSMPKLSSPLLQGHHINPSFQLHSPSDKSGMIMITNKQEDMDLPVHNSIDNISDSNILFSISEHNKVRNRRKNSSASIRKTH